jgi:hypothetical protein
MGGIVIRLTNITEVNGLVFEDGTSTLVADHKSMQALSDFLLDLTYRVGGFDESDCEFDYDTPFIEYMGGDIVLIETKEEAENICTVVIDPKDESRYLTLGEEAAVFDAAEYILDGDYAQLFLCTNNEGGSTYIIPRKVADQVANIEVTMKLTAEAWNAELNAASDDVDGS